MPVSIIITMKPSLKTILAIKNCVALRWRRSFGTVRMLSQLTLDLEFEGNGVVIELDALEEVLEASPVLA